MRYIRLYDRCHMNEGLSLILQHCQKPLQGCRYNVVHVRWLRHWEAVTIRVSRLDSQVLLSRILIAQVREQAFLDFVDVLW
jgi:hypothetical protein